MGNQSSRSVKVRVAVAVDHTGDWNSCGWGNLAQEPGHNDNEAMGMAIDPLEAGENRFFLVAELPLPVAVDVDATVETSGTKEES